MVKKKVISEGHVAQSSRLPHGPSRRRTKKLTLLMDGCLMPSY